MRGSIVLLLAACRAVDEAPQDLDAVLHDAWWAYDGAGDLGAAAEALIALADPDALLDEPVDGTQSRLTATELTRVDLRAPPDDDGTWRLPDPALARPIFLLNRFTCDLDQLERVLIHLDQDALFEAYDAYSRSYTSDDAAFRDGATDVLTWEAVASASYFGAGSYTETLDGGVRRFDLAAGRGLAGRTWIPFPAHNDGGAIQLRQDYQIEVYVPWGDGDVLHLYGVWRELDLGALGTMEKDTVARVTLNNLAAWDDKVEALCADGVP
ncbi:MAG TPA: hypothetical protein PKA64_14385 [Myxococcota bacterium]|nr:hypothetical protein [Myxococcota bacterium]